MTGGLGRGRGYALRLPVLDIAEVGAGGGLDRARRGGRRARASSHRKRRGGCPGPPRTAGRDGRDGRRRDARAGLPQSRRDRGRCGTTPAGPRRRRRSGVTSRIPWASTRDGGLRRVPRRRGHDGACREGGDDVPRSIPVGVRGARVRGQRPALRGCPRAELEIRRVIVPRGGGALLVGRAARRGRGAASRAGDRGRAGRGSIRRPWQDALREPGTPGGGRTSGRRADASGGCGSPISASAANRRPCRCRRPTRRADRRALRGARPARSSRSTADLWLCVARGTHRAREPPVILTAGETELRRERGAAHGGRDRVRPSRAAGGPGSGGTWAGSTRRSSVGPTCRRLRPGSADRRGIRRHDAGPAGVPARTDDHGLIVHRD